ncbi:MAG: aliphatic sulfonate ABC transporter substrate-binding protein [Desulfuromonadaceae bacterium]
MKGKQVVAAGLIAVGALLTGAVQSGFAAEAKPKEVVIGVQVIPNGEILAKAKGWYEKELGTKVNFKQFDSGRDVNTALASNAIDIGLLGTTPAAVGIARGIPYEVFWIHDVIGEAESLAVKNKSAIKSVKDLVGKKVAVPVGSTAHFSLLSALKLAGVKPADVKILDLQPPDILAAWQRGDIDAAYVWQPTLGKLLADDGTAVTDSRQLAKKGFVTADIGVVRSEFARTYPELVTNYVKIQLKAYKHYKSDFKDTSATIGKAFNIDKAEAAKEINELVWLSGKEQLSKAYFGSSAKKGALPKILKSTADFLVEQKSIDKAPGLDIFEKAVNPSFIEKALK